MSSKPILVTTPDSVGTLQSRWNTKDFDDFITDKGYECYIDRALMCPCKEKGNGSAMSDCMNCQGTGWFFINRRKSKVACTSMSNRTKYEVWSPTNAGTVNISARQSDKMGMMDRVILTELESWFSQLLYLKDSVESEDDPNGDYKFAFTIYELLSVNNIYLYINNNTPLTYINDDSFKVVNNKVFVKNTIIPAGVINPCVSIDYCHNPAFHVIDINRDLIKQKNGVAIDAQKVNMPINCIGRRAHYVLDQVDYFNNRVFDNTNYNKV